MQKCGATQKTFHPVPWVVETVHRNQRRTLTSSRGSSTLRRVPLGIYNLLRQLLLLAFSFHECLDLRLRNNLEIGALPASHGVTNLFWFYASTDGVSGHNCTRWLFLLVWKVNICVRASAKANTFAFCWKNNEDLSDFKLAFVNEHLNAARFLFLLLLMLHWRYSHVAARCFFLFLLFLCLSKHLHSSCNFSCKIQIAINKFISKYT